MTYIKINDTLYPATVEGKMSDSLWGRRNTKTITLEMDYATAVELFVDDMVWSIAIEYPVEVQTLDEEGNTIKETITETEEYDNSDYCVAGPITDNRDGTLSIKMGKYTNEEILLMEVLA